MLGNATKSFVDMVVFRELIKSNIKSEKVKVGESLGSRKAGLTKKKKGKA